jgi:hypothetical protein
MTTPVTSIPTVSAQGWVTDIDQKGDRILSYFIITDYSQSNRWQGEIASLPQLVKGFDNSTAYLEEQITQKLDNLMRRNFGSDVSVRVRVTNVDESNPTHLSIRMGCDITYANVVYSLGKQVEFLNGKLQVITKLTNG